MKKEFSVEGTFNLLRMHYQDAEHFLSMAKESKKSKKSESEKPESIVSGGVKSFMLTK